MTEEEEVSELLKKASELGLDLVLILGVSEDRGSVILHNAGNDLDASFMLKTFTATLEMSILEDLYDRGKRTLN